MSKWIKEIIVRYDDKQSFIYGNTLGEVVGELVRCKECKLGGTEDCPMDEIDDEYFCNFGERSE